jgi:voltage-gated potassium channel Kch
MSLIVLSVVTFCIETLPEFHRKNQIVWFTIESVCILAFTIEFILRAISTPNCKKFLLDAYTIIDLLAIVPFYFELPQVIDDVSDGIMGNDETSGVSTAFFRVLRLLRVLRVFKMARYLSWMNLFTVSIKQSLQPLGMFCFFVLIVVIVFATIIFYLERGSWVTIDGTDIYVNAIGEPSKFVSIPDAMYWCFITMTTVGYGDMYPVTVGGKFVAALASVTGIFVLAIPITIISSNFNREYEREKRERAEAQAKMQMIRNHFSMKKRGLNALSDEIQNMITHKTAVYKRQVADLIDASRIELIDEIEELVKLAYQCRIDANREKQKTKSSPTSAPSPSTPLRNRNSALVVPASDQTEASTGVTVPVL